MTSSLFESWVHKLDKHFQRQKRSILLIVDNCPAHPHVEGLTNVKLAFFPPNATSKLQPTDQGVIRALKAWYRKKLLAKLISSLDQSEEYSVSILDALHFINASWNEISANTLQNCFRKAGFDNLSEEAAPKESYSDTDVEQEVQEQLHFLRRNGMTGLENVDPEDYINADEEITIAGNLTNDDIVAHVQGKNGVTEDLDDSDDDVEAVIPEVTLGEASLASPAPFP